MVWAIIFIERITSKKKILDSEIALFSKFIKQNV